MPNLSLKEVIYRWRVRTCLLCLILVVLLARPVLASLLAGVILCCFGLAIRAWAAGHLRKEKELTVSGPYSFTRNPLYLGNFVIGISVATASCSWWILSLFIVYFLLFYPLVIKKEEEKMSALFPEEFEEYREKVPLFFPSFKKASLARKSKFSSKLYRKNREWRAFVGALFFWLILAAKMIIIQARAL
jgi:protein-S-isoprenylcysteine O-methyltransferase Ste14